MLVPSPSRVRGALLGIAAFISGCGGSDGRTGAQLPGGGVRPDEHPVLVNKDLPFRYPPPLYARKVQGNVTLRLFIDANGQTRPESTRVEQSSGYGSLDSAAVAGSQTLLFLPAKLNGEAVGVTVLFPVYFRHPEAPPLAGDTVLGMREAGSGKRADTTASRSALPASRP
jgi:TonB family protein